MANIGGYRLDSNRRLVGKNSSSAANVILKNEAMSLTSRHQETPSRSSPDSSTVDDYSSSSFRCPQCPVLCADEPSLTGHLLRVHHARLIKTEVPTATTRCPVCRQLVTDLSHHFAVGHSEKRTINLGSANNNNNNNIRADEKVSSNVTSSRNSPPFVQLTAAAAISAGTALDASRVIPIFLPSHPLPESQLTARNDTASSVDDPVSPMNLSLRRSSGEIAESSKMEAKSEVVTTIVNGSATSRRSVSNNNNNSLNFNHSREASRSAEDSEMEESASNFSGEFQSHNSAESRKRRKQTHVPNESKDDKYWARRMKNNEAAKRSRDMRIRREKVVFEENARLEQDNRELRTELDRVVTENKELHLKMGLILDENVRLKNIIYSMQQQNGSEEQQT